MTTKTSQVHLGHWIDWSSGATKGSTITLTRKDGALLTAFTALFVSYAGSRIWKIVCFALYLRLSDESPKEAVYHQRQALLRNNASGQATIWDLCSMLWVWRKIIGFKSITHQIMPLLALSVVMSLAIATAGVFSAQISSSRGNKVLLQGRNCALVMQTLNNSQSDLQTYFWPYIAGRNSAAYERANQCYTTKATSDSCSMFVKPKLPLLISRNASCPFQDRICRSKSGNILLDTGHLNSYHDFGINMPPEDRFTFRQVFHCAPLVMDEYSDISESYLNKYGNFSTFADGRKFQKFYYGKYRGQKGNFTYQYPLNNANGDLGMTADGLDYTIMLARAVANNTEAWTAGFESIEELMRPDADTILMFLSANNIVYTAKVDDPWYSARRPGGAIKDNVTKGAASYYLKDYATNVLGCTTQFQYCNPNLPHDPGCGPLTAIKLISEPKELAMFSSDLQKELFMPFFNIIKWCPSNMPAVLSGLGTGFLRARKSLTVGRQGPLPSNQWQLEMETLVSTILAGQQQTFIDYVKGDSSLGDQFLQTPRTEQERERGMCNSQLILSTDYTSFSTLGLTLTFAIGGLFIIVSYWLEPLLHWIQRKWKWSTAALIEWDMNDRLKLQSSVHETLGLGTWKREVGVVPTTLKGEKLAILDLSKDPMHPNWRALPQNGMAA